MNSVTTQSIETRFGVVEYTNADIISFAEGMIGFPNENEFVLIQHRENSPFRWLQSISTKELAFLVVDPAIYVPSYAPEVALESVGNLELVEETPRLVYTVVNIPRGKPEEMTLNLAGPIVINTENQRAKQLVLEENKYSLRHPVVATEHNKAA